MGMITITCIVERSTRTHTQEKINDTHTHLRWRTGSLMARWHYSKQPGSSSYTRYGRPRSAYGGIEQQATLKIGNRDVRQTTLDNWSAGADELEAKMARIRAVTHQFVPMGKLSACERCGSGVDDQIDGRQIHFSE